MTADDSPALQRAMQVYLAWKAKPDREPVTEFLAAHDELRHVLAPMLERDQTLTENTPVQDEADGSPERIGPYRILRVLGEGGMGTVYLAEQREPVRRRVALKVIKLGMASNQIIARFEQERQALAVMSHPTVAKVFEAGITEQGQSFFVMEFVEGEPLTDYCDRHKLSLKERIEVFQQICRGVQHAHQKGVVHRDLKPGNILVARKENEHTVKIIDFGLARATDQQLVDQTIFTEQGQMIGTPEYMSPEQASGEALDIDTRTDVYSLGIVLYELLTGELPFTSQQLRQAGLMEIQRIIADVEPPKPSTRVSTLGESANDGASRRRMSTNAFRKELRGDLDWIVLKAMAKEPERRYESATGLAMDLERFLAHQPVLAGRPSALYRARKFVRRNRIGVVAGVLIAAGVVVGILGVVSGRAERIAQQPSVDLNWARQVVAQADQLWPAVPDKIPAMKSWLERAIEVRSALEEYPAALKRIREERADEIRPDPKTGPDAVHLADMKLELAFRSRYLDRSAEGRVFAIARAGGNPSKAAERIPQLRVEIAALEEKVAARRIWEFEDDGDQVRQDVLVELVEILGVLVDDRTGLLGSRAVSEEHGWSVPKRIEIAEQMKAGFATGGEYAIAWAELLPDIHADHPNLIRQAGLVPLWKDPASKRWEFWHVASGARPQRSDGRIKPDAKMGIVLVLIPGGTFTMGAQSAKETGKNYHSAADPSKESPPHEVSVGAFFLSKYEMTQGQWKRFVGRNPITPERWRRYGLDKPVNMVTWTEISRTMSRLGLRLPHEKQWEYAAHGPDGHPVRPWPSGDPENPFRGFANLNDQSVPLNWKDRVLARGGGTPVDWNDGFGFTAPIGFHPPQTEDESKGVKASVGVRPNPFGLHNVYGNVTEGCSNCYYDYRSGVSGRGHLARRMARGGHFWTPAANARPSFRAFEGVPEFKESFVGVRPARDIDR